MSANTASVLYAVTWFLVMFVVLPIRLRTQEEEGDIVAGTHAGAPADFRVWRTMALVTLIATLLWSIELGVALSGWITLEELGQPAQAPSQ